MIDMNDENTLEFIQEGIYLLLFFSECCRLCAATADILIDLENEMSHEISFVRLNFDKCQLCNKIFSITTVPTVVSIINGKTEDIVSGLHNPQLYKNLAEKLLFLKKTY